MEIQPLKKYYNIHRTTPCNLIVFHHTDDTGTRYIELLLRDSNRQPVDISGASAIARVVTKNDKRLLADNVPCTVSESSVTIPLDGAVMRSRKSDLYVEVSIHQGDKVLTLPFPLWIRVQGSILEDASATDQTIGTIAELLRDAAEELARVQELVNVKKGDSAYQVAVNNGYEGTEAEWLASLQGEDYVLTVADKQDIAQRVMSMLPSAEEGSY